MCGSIASAMNQLHPEDFIITRKRKKYKFALFHNSPLCFELGEWRKSFQPTVLELGAGTGKFSVALAVSNPSKKHVAVDVKADRLQTGARQAAEQNMVNLRFLRAHAQQLRDILQPHSLEAIWLTFPDPFNKERSAKHRLTHPKFLDLYAELLKPTGKVYLKTDAVALFDWSLEQLADAGWHIQDLSFDLHHSNASDIAKTPTTYEQRYVREGKKICYVVAPPPKR